MNAEDYACTRFCVSLFDANGNVKPSKKRLRSSPWYGVRLNRVFAQLRG